MAVKLTLYQSEDEKAQMNVIVVENQAIRSAISIDEIKSNYRNPGNDYCFGNYS